MYVCMYMCTCRCICIHVYTFVYECVYILVDRLWVSVSVSLRVGWCHECACAFVCICMRVHVCVCTYICALTGVLGTSAWAGVYVTQVFFDTNVHICEHTRRRLFKYVYIHI